MIIFLVFSVLNGAQSSSPNAVVVLTHQCLVDFASKHLAERMQQQQSFLKYPEKF